MSSKVKTIFITAFFILFLFPQAIFAVTVTVDSYPPSISSAPFSLTVSVLGANAGKNYLRVDLSKEGTSPYFGETYNGNEWYFGSSGTSYFPIDIISSTSTASATFQAQVGELSSTSYLGPGAYKLRIRRYTSASSYAPSDLYDITIDIPTPSPTPDLTAAPTSNPTPTPTPTPTPVKTPTPAPKKTPSPAPTVAGTSPSGDSAQEGILTPQPEVQGIRDEMNLLGDSSESAGITDKKGPPIIPIILISCGGIFIVGAGLALAKKGKSEYNLKENESVTQNN